MYEKILQKMESFSNQAENEKISSSQKNENIDSQQQPINSWTRSSLRHSSSSSSKSAKSLISIISVMVLFFLIFILWMIWSLSSLQKSVYSSTFPTLPARGNLINVTIPQFEQVNDEQDKLLDSLGQKILFAKYLLPHPEDSESTLKEKHRIERKYYQRLYGGAFDEVRHQIPMCIVATGRNNMRNERQKRFLSSVEDLNYTNYRLIYVDDNSEDMTAQFTYSFINASRKLQEKTQVIERNGRFFALANKIKGIEYCGPSDIILDVDADDCFLGRQVLNVVNYLYTQNVDAWLLYTNHLISDKNGVELGKNRGLVESQWEEYRSLDLWVTSHLKTFKRDLFKKINQEEWKREDGQYYHWASDRFLMYPLIQLAGPTHTVFQNVILYLYDYGAAGEFRNFQVIKPDKFKSQILVPYEHLQALSSVAAKRLNYQPPTLIQEYYRRAKLKYEELSRRGTIKQ